MSARLARGAAALAVALTVAFGGMSCARLDSFLFNPTPAPAGGYDLAACPTGDPDAPPVGDAIPPAAVDTVVLTAGGETLDARFVRAADPAASATVLYSHGNAENLCRYWGRVQLFYELGLNVLVYDYEGYGASTGEASEEALYRDVRAALEYLRGREDVDQTRIVYYGWSLGGAAAIDLAVTDPPAALVTESAFASVSAFLSDSAGVDLPSGFLARSSLDNLAKVARLENVPYLVLHGDADDFVRPGYAQELFDAAPGPKRLYLAPGADHDTVPYVDLPAYRDEVGAWVETYAP